LAKSNNQKASESEKGGMSFNPLSANYVNSRHDDIVTSDGYSASYRRSY